MCPRRKRFGMCCRSNKISKNGESLLQNLIYNLTFSFLFVVVVCCRTPSINIYLVKKLLMFQQSSSEEITRLPTSYKVIIMVVGLHQIFIFLDSLVLFGLVVFVSLELQESSTTDIIIWVITRFRHTIKTVYDQSTIKES